MQAEATDLIEEGGRVVGVRAKTPDGTLTIRADLVVGCDGRHSTVRQKAGFVAEDYGAPMDVLWFRMSRKAGDQADAFGHVEAGVMLVMLDRGDYWQCAYVIPKGGFEGVRAKGIDAFREKVLWMSPFLGERIGELKSFDDVKLLTVTVDRLKKWWRPGIICIGDSAHAMSPIGGVGINIAVQDAVAAANRLAAPLKAGTVTDADLQAIQDRRTLPVRFTQWMQLTIQKRLISEILQSQQRPKPPFLIRIFGMFPFLRGIPARLVGMGIRPEHVHTPDCCFACREAALNTIAQLTPSAIPSRCARGFRPGGIPPRRSFSIRLATRLAQMIEGGFDQRRQIAPVVAVAARLAPPAVHAFADRGQPVEHDLDQVAIGCPR